jgi:NitT/TauT family transport system substrate-binding protein
MRAQHAAGWSWRQCLGGVTLGGTAGLLSLRPVHVAAEPPPEATRLRVHHSLSRCLAPQYVAEELLRGEGFTEVHYVKHEEAGGFYPALASGAADIGNDFAPVLIRHVDAGDPITILGGVHVGLPPMSSSPV